MQTGRLTLGGVAEAMTWTRLLGFLGAVGLATPVGATCAPMDFDGTAFTICTFQVGQDDIRLFHSDLAGRPYRHFYNVARDLAESGERLAFAMNAGMYHSDLGPVGLFIEDGRTVTPLVTQEGPGNFGMIPNGVFCLGEDEAQVLETMRYVREYPDCTFATQSGPMLVIDGALHPRFIPGGTSIHIRNGVGVEADRKTVHFAISNVRVNFETFGRLFRDALGTPNALYFDGKVSRLLAPDLGRSDGGFAIGPMVGVVVSED